MYSSVLTENHPRYSRTGCDLSDYYYEAIRILVNESDYYTLSSNSSMDTYGYIYKKNFYPFSPSINLILENDESSNDGQFGLKVFLRTNTVYILVVTTFEPSVTEAFSIIVSASNNVVLEFQSEYLFYL